MLERSAPPGGVIGSSAAAKPLMNGRDDYPERGLLRYCAGSMFDILDKARQKLARDRDLPVRVLARKGADYALGIASAALFLRRVDRVGRGVRTLGRPRIENFGTMELGDFVHLRSIMVPVELATSAGARLTVGEHTFINYGASVGATGEITIGRRCNIGPYVMIIDTSFHDAYDRSRVPPPRPVHVEDDVFLGAKCSIMPGVRVGRGAIVATAAVVTRDVEPFTVVAGIPAKVIERLDPNQFVAHAARQPSKEPK